MIYMIYQIISKLLCIKYFLFNVRRICETFEFSELLDAAVREEDTDTQMLNIAAFCVGTRLP